MNADTQGAPVVRKVKDHGRHLLAKRAEIEVFYHPDDMKGADTGEGIIQRSIQGVV